MTAYNRTNLDIEIINVADRDGSPKISSPDLLSLLEDMNDSCVNVIDEWPDNWVMVKKPSDFGTIDSSKEYIIGVSDLDMGLTQIEVPSTGVNIQSLNPETCRIYTTENNYTMFVAADAPSGAGGIRCKGVKFEVSGTNSQVFDVDNTNGGGNDEFSIENCVFNNCTSLGYVAGYRQVFMNNIAVLNGIGGIELDKNITGARITLGVSPSFPASTTFIQAGTTLSLGNFLTDFNFFNVDATSVFCDFSPSNMTGDYTFIVEGFRTNADDAFPNMPTTATEAFFSNNRGVPNTYQGASIEWTSQTATTFGGVNTPTKLLGTTTSSNLVHFSQTANNRIQCDTEEPNDYTLEGGIDISGGSNDLIWLTARKWDESASSYVDLRVFQKTIRNYIGTDTASFYIRANAGEMSFGDFIEIWGENRTDTTTITVLNGSYVDVYSR